MVSTLTAAVLSLALGADFVNNPSNTLYTNKSPCPAGQRCTSASQTLKASETNAIRDALIELRKQSGGYINVTTPPYNADPTGVADSTAALAAWAAAASPGAELILPPGTYNSTAALTVAATGVTIRGVRGKSVLNFTGATNGIVIPDAAPATKDIVIEGVQISTSNAGAGKALLFDFPANAGTSITLRDVTVRVTGSGQWTHGLYGNNFQTSTITSLKVQSSATTGVYMENSSNAVQFYNLEVDGPATRAVDAATTSELYVLGGTLQGAFSASALRVSSSSFIGYAIHFENTDTTPSDGADVVTAGTASTVELHGGGAPSVLTAGTGPAVHLFGGSYQDVTLGSSTKMSSMVGCDAKTITDNTTSAFLAFANRANSGNLYTNRIPSYIAGTGTAALSTLTGPELRSTAALIMANNTELAALDAAGGTARPMIKMDTSGQTLIAYTAGKSMSLNSGMSSNRITMSDTAITMYDKLTFNGAGDSTGTPGNATLNTSSGKSAIASGAAAVTITNSKVTAASIIQVVLQTTDATATAIKSVIPGSNTFTVNVNASATGNVNIGWVVFN